jgi:hypothetical protein
MRDRYITPTNESLIALAVRLQWNHTRTPLRRITDNPTSLV